MLTMSAKNITFKITNVENPSIGSIISSSIGSPTPEKIAGVLKSYEQPNQFLIGAFASENLIGIIGFELKDGQATIKHISVVEQCRKQGVGKSLINRLIKDYTPSKISLETDDESIAFYTKLGFDCTIFSGEFGGRYRCSLNSFSKLTATSHTEAIEWVMQALKTTEMNTAVVVETPWSNVLKISTLQGSVYLKQMPPDLFIEVDVIQKCRELCKITEIPEIISANKNLHCFLMKECGDVSLRTLFNGHLNVNLLVQGLQIYIRMQKATAQHVDAFLQAGVPDWRLRHFSKLYQDLVNNEEFLQTHGLEVTQIKILQNAVRKVETLCQELSNYGIPECLNHSDFHENNMLFSKDTQKISIIDLGETAVNHPLFSLSAFLTSPCDRYHIAFASIEYQKLHETCFNEWLVDKKSMTRVLEIINMLLPVYLLFTQKRFLDAINLPYNADNPMSVKQHDKINKGFIWLIDNIEAEV
jgi:GNAT superfamily N-acetyltransferase